MRFAEMRLDETRLHIAAIQWSRNDPLGDTF